MDTSDLERERKLFKQPFEAETVNFSDDEEPGNEFQWM